MGDHAWLVTGGYDPDLDGPEPRWGRRAVRCGRCGEVRRVWCGVDLAAAPMLAGCPALPAAVLSPGWPEPEPRPAVRPVAVPAGLRAATAVAAVLAVFCLACITAGWYPPWPVSWGLAMAAAGVVCRGVLDSREARR